MPGNKIAVSLPFNLLLRDVKDLFVLPVDQLVLPLSIFEPNHACGLVYDRLQQRFVLAQHLLRLFVLQR